MTKHVTGSCCERIVQIQYVVRDPHKIWGKYTKNITGKPSKLIIPLQPLGNPCKCLQN